MVTKLQDANIVIEIDEGRAKAELERFRQLLGQQGAAFAREREGEQKKEEGHAKKGMAKEKRGAIKSLSDVGRGITNAINSIKRATLETAIAGGLGLVLGAGAAPMARAITRAGIMAAEFGPEVAAGAIKGVLGDTKIPDPVLAEIQRKLAKFSEDVVATKAAVQAIGQTTDQVSKIGVSLAVGGMEDLMTSGNFASKMTRGIYDYNRAQIGARRHAYIRGMGYFAESVGSIMGNIFSEGGGPR